MLWSVRRRIKQYIRSRGGHLSYVQMRKRSSYWSFAYYFLTWNLLGFAVYKVFFTRLDEVTGETLLLDPTQGDEDGNTVPAYSFDMWSMTMRPRGIIQIKPQVDDGEEDE